MGIKGQIQKTVNKKASRKFDWLFKNYYRKFFKPYFLMKAQKN